MLLTLLHVAGNEKLVPQQFAPCVLFSQSRFHFFPQHKTRYAIIGSWPYKDDKLLSKAASITPLVQSTLPWCWIHIDKRLSTRELCVAYHAFDMRYIKQFSLRTYHDSYQLFFYLLSYNAFHFSS